MVDLGQTNCEGEISISKSDLSLENSAKLHENYKTIWINKLANWRGELGKSTFLMHIVLFTLSISHLRFNRQLRQWLKKNREWGSPTADLQFTSLLIPKLNIARTWTTTQTPLWPQPTSGTATTTTAPSVSGAMGVGAATRRRARPWRRSRGSRGRCSQTPHPQRSVVWFQIGCVLQIESCVCTKFTTRSIDIETLTVSKALFLLMFHLLPQLSAIMTQ